MSYVILVDKRVVVLMCEQPHESIATVVLIIIILAVPDTGHWALWAQLGLERRRKTEWMPSASVKNMPEQSVRVANKPTVAKKNTSV